MIIVLSIPRIPSKFQMVPKRHERNPIVDIVIRCTYLLELRVVDLFLNRSPELYYAKKVHHCSDEEKIRYSRYCVLFLFSFHFREKIF